MQAVLVFVVTGVLMAIIAGFTSNGAESSRQLTLNYIQQTKSYLDEAEDILTKVTVPVNMQVPAPSLICNGSDEDSEGIAYTSKSVGPYLCRQELARLATWSFANRGTNDPWGRPFQGIVITRTMAVAPGVEAPVTTFAIISSGPDRQLGPNLQAQLADTVSTVDSVADARQAMMRVMRLTADLDTAAGNDTDDIAYTFSTQRAQEKRWAVVEDALNRIGLAALRSYQEQFRQYQPDMTTAYEDNVTSYFNPATGVIDLTTTTLNLWKNQTGPGVPSMDSPSLATGVGRRQLGVDGDFDLITQNIASGGSGMDLTATVTDSTYGQNDVLTLNITNRNSPWGAGGGAVGYISYTMVITAGGN